MQIPMRYKRGIRGPIECPGKFGFQVICQWWNLKHFHDFKPLTGCFHHFPVWFPWISYIIKKNLWEFWKKVRGTNNMISPPLSKVGVGTCPPVPHLMTPMAMSINDLICHNRVANHIYQVIRLHIFSLIVQDWRKTLRFIFVMVRMEINWWLRNICEQLQL